MSNISITELNVHRFLPDINDRIDLAKGIGGIELAIKFNIQPEPGYPYQAEIQIAIYDANNQLIYWLHQGSRTYSYGETVWASIPAIVPANLTNIRVEAWMTDNTITGKIKTPWGFNSNVKNRISNIATRSLNLSSTIHGTRFDRTRGQQTTVKEPTVVTGVKPFEKQPRVSVFQPKKTLSSNTQNIINGIESGSITVPSWFMNNVTWVQSGQITETEFVNAYNFLTPQVTISPMPDITFPSIPAVSAEMELITTNFQVKLNNKIQFTSSLSNADYKRLQDEMSLEPKITLVFLNQTDFKPLSNFSKILRQIQKLLEGQVVETITPTGQVITETITPTGEVITAPEPTVAPGKGLMGAGVLGIIGILMLGGFIADHVRKRK